jgi:hypothetical protein
MFGTELRLSPQYTTFERTTSQQDFGYHQRFQRDGGGLQQNDAKSSDPRIPDTATFLTRPLVRAAG